MPRADGPGSDCVGDGSAGQAGDVHEPERAFGSGVGGENEIAPETDLIVIQDELDFPLGTLRIHRKRSSAGHNGIESVIGALGTQDFLRIRLGVAPERKVSDGVSYLLSPLRKAELEVTGQLLDTAAEAVKVILTEGEAAAMNRYNRKPEQENED